MANHEVNITCRNCSNEFDARLHGTQCPRCSAQYMFNPNKPKVMSKELFHISKNELLRNGFSLHTTNGNELIPDPTEKYRKLDTYTRVVSRSIKLMVAFVYSVSTATGRETLDESVVYMGVTGNQLTKLRFNNLKDILDFYYLLVNSIEEVA